MYQAWHIVVTRTEYTQAVETLICWYARPAPPSFHGTGGVLAFIRVINSVQLCSKASRALPVSTDWLVLSCCSKHSCVTAAAYLIHFPCVIFHRCGGETTFTSKLKQKMIFLQTVFPHFKQEQAPIHISTKVWQTTEDTLMKRSPTQNTGRSKTKQKAVSVHCASRGFMFTEWLSLCSVFRASSRTYYSEGMVGERWTA